jgi:hypothetical protein
MPLLGDDEPVVFETIAETILVRAMESGQLSASIANRIALEKAGVEFVAADMPQANRLTIGIMAVMAQHEREMISTRTKAALQAAKQRGVKLGGDRGYVITAKARAAGKAVRRAKAQARASDLAPVVQELQASGCESLRGIAAGLDERGIPAARGGKWSAAQVARLLGAAGIPFGGSVANGVRLGAAPDASAHVSH